MNTKEKDMTREQLKEKTDYRSYCKTMVEDGQTPMNFKEYRTMQLKAKNNLKLYGLA